MTEWVLIRRKVRVTASSYAAALEKIEEGNGLREGVFDQQVLRYVEGDAPIPVEEIGELATRGAAYIQSRKE